MNTNGNGGSNGRTQGQIPAVPSRLLDASDPEGEPVAQLIQRLSSDRGTRFFLTMNERFRDIHLKNLRFDSANDQRQITVDGRLLLNFGSDSFLGLDRDPRVIEALTDGAQRWGAHSGASRAFYSYEINVEAERRLARWLGVEDTLILPSTTLINLGVLPAIADHGDLLVVDRLAHNSVQEGAKLAHEGGALVETLHPAIPDVLDDLLSRHPNRAGKVVALDGVYSMTGAILPLRQFDAVARRHGGILYIDDAHGTGLLGECGRGAAFRELGSLRGSLVIGSLSKAFSCMGAFVTCTPDLKLLLQMKSGPYIFGGPVPPPYLEAICTVCDILESPDYERLRGRLFELIRRLVTGAQSLGYRVLGGQSPIVSLAIGDIGRTLALGRALFDRGYYVQSVAFPAVPFNESLVRIQVNANHEPAQIDGLLNALADAEQSIAPPKRQRAVAT